MYYLGIDGSDRYTKLLILDENNKILGRHSGPSTNILRVPAVTMPQTCVSLVKEINRLTNTAAGGCVGLCFAVPTGAAAEHGPSFKRLFRSMGFTCNIKVVNVERALLAAKIGYSPGALLLAGDDVSGYALKSDGEELYMGNYGTLFETGGAAYSIGLHVLRNVIKTLDGRGAATILVGKVAEELGVGPTEILKTVRAKDFDKKHIYSFAGLAHKASALGDKCAREIEAYAAFELADFGVNLLNKAKDEGHGSLVLGGAVLLLNENLAGNVTELLGDKLPGTNILLGDEKAEYGAAILAKDIK